MTTSLRPRGKAAAGINLRPLLAVLLIFSVSAVSGCGSEWKKKFVRKRKNAKVTQPILTLQPDYKAVMPAKDRYREHFAFWQSWHTELLNSFGQLKRRDLSHLNGAIGELSAMQAILTGEPSQRLKKIVEDLDAMKERWSAAPLASHPAADRSTLERFQREISKNFHYSNIKETVVPEPE